MRENLDHPHVVGLYFSRLGNAGGGAERMICQLAGALAERGFYVYLLYGMRQKCKHFIHCILGFRRGTFIIMGNE